ncbi:MAG: GNAT family N-acetyltransferase [Candidatus Limnocylindrales bacterium]
MQSPRKPPNRINEHGERQAAPTWESLVDRQIREAMDEGKFDHLPFQGQPLPRVDDAFAGEWAMAYTMLRNAGVAPPWIEADKDVRALLVRREAIVARAASSAASGSRSAFTRRRDRAALEALVVEINAAIARLNAEAPTDRQHRRPLVLAQELARLEAPQPPQPPQPPVTQPAADTVSAIRVRRAAPSHAPAIRAIADAAWRVTYRDLLHPETIDWFLDRAYSEDRVGLRIERHETWVAELDGAVSAFAESAIEADRVTLVAIYADPERRGLGLGTALLDAITGSHPGLPIAADVLAGNTAGEPFYAARGFAPEEDVDEELGGERVLERRWWLRPRVAELVVEPSPTAHDPAGTGRDDAARDSPPDRQERTIPG